MPVTHTVKCWPEYFDAIKRGDKPFDVRRDDRGYQKGDQLVLLRTCEEKNRRHIVEYAAGGKPRHSIQREITYVLTGGQFGIEPGYVVLGLQH